MSNIKKTLDKCLFFTGAGFSKPAGCKLSVDMLKDLEKRSNGKDNLFTEIERKTIKFILSCLDYHARWRTLEIDGKYSYSPNIEEFALLLRRIKNRENLLPYPITGNWSDKITLLEQEFKKEKDSESDLYDSIESKIMKECYNDWLNPKENWIKPKKESTDRKPFLLSLREFFQAIPETEIKLEVFTLNNDRVLEEYFKDENSVYSGFVSNRWVGFDRKHIDDDTYNAGRINYYKLHGSIDWIRMPDGTVKKKSVADETSEDNDIEIIYPFLIFGHGTKLFTVDPFFSLLKAFNEKLMERKYFFIIGYSFFDPHINNLFFYELMNKTEQNKKMIIINPDMASLKNLDYCFESKYGFDKVLNKDSAKEVIRYFKDIQKNSFYSDMPEFNISQISTESFIYIQTKGENFIDKAFSKDANGNYGIMKFIMELEEESKKGVFE